MVELPCEVVRDLLPSYVDGLTCETTNELVDAHIETCALCRAALAAMRAPEAEPENNSSVKEIDFLKKNKRRNRAVVLWSLVGALLLAFAVLFMRVFVIGEELSYGCVVPRNIRVEGNHLTADLDCMDSARVISEVYYEEQDGVVTLRARGVLVSFLHGPGARAEYTASEPIRQVRMPERIYWADGEAISKLASDVYLTRHDYVGDMPANKAAADALGISERFGPYENELHTAKLPYCWTIRFQNDLGGLDGVTLADEMEQIACILFATIGNLDTLEVEYDYNGSFIHYTFSADYYSKLLGQDIKTFGESPKALEDLIRRVELKTF